MNRTTMPFLCLITSFFSAGCATTPPGDWDAAPMTERDGTPRIGVFDSRGVALAYGRSSRPDALLARVDDLEQRHERAERIGDERRMQELAAEGQALQRHMHEQVFGGAPIDDILTLMEADLPDVAARAGVDLIVEGVVYDGARIELVDVTLPMCLVFEPDTDTRRSIDELLATAPVPLSELSHHH